MKHPDFDSALEALKACQSETVPASMIAPVLNMNPQVIIRYAKTGEWDQDLHGKFIVSGDRVKFFRRDFLQKHGFMEPEPEKPTVEQLLEKVVYQLKQMNMLKLATMDAGQQLRYELMLDKEKTADAATPTD